MASGSILVVDDEKIVLDPWSKVLAMEGYHVQIALTPSQALDHCDTHHFDLVLLDFLMPQMTGLELLHRIRKKQPLVRTIISSGKIDQTVASEGSIAETLYAGLEVDRYLHKPVDNQKLLDAVADLLGAPVTRDWKEIAKKTVAADAATLKKSKEIEKTLRSMKAKKRK